MVMRVGVMARLGVLLSLGAVMLVSWSGTPVQAQVIVGEREQAAFASVNVGEYPVSVLIAYQGDSALLLAAVPVGEGGLRYIPLIASTYRGLPSFQLDILSPDANDEIWIRMSAPRSEPLAVYRPGSDAAVTQFGLGNLLETPFPGHLSGGPVAFPQTDADALRLRASFYHYDNP